MATLDTGTTPQGYSGATAVAAVENYTNETTYPGSATILTFLNKGLEEVVRRVGGIKLLGQYPTVTNQTTVTFNDDVQDIISANFSYGSNSTTNSGSASPFTVGAMVQPIELMDQKAFMEFAAGFPNVGFGPPCIGFVFQDYGSSPNQTLPAPSAPTLATIAGTSNNATVYVVNTYTNASGETTASSSSSQSPGSTAYQVQNLSPQAVSNATGYNTYASTSSSGPFHLQNGSTPNTLGQPYTIPYPLLTATATPPTTNTAIGAGTGGAMSMQLYPNCMTGQLNIYYRARPLLWADTTTSSWTNLDTSVQEAAVLFAVMRTLMNRQRGDEVGPWKKEYDEMIDDLKESVNRRTISKSGQVRDVRASYPVGGYLWRR